MHTPPTHDLTGLQLAFLVSHPLELQQLQALASSVGVRWASALTLDTTHAVVPPGARGARFEQAVALGLPLVSRQWLEDLVAKRELPLSPSHHAA